MKSLWRLIVLVLCSTEDSPYFVLLHPILALVNTKILSRTALFRTRWVISELLLVKANFFTNTVNDNGKLLRCVFLAM